MKPRMPSGLFTLLFVGLLAGCASHQKLAQIEETKQLEKTHLENFDDLDFNVYSNQKWDQLGKSHAKDVVVHWPDGRTTHGIEDHIEDLKAMFVFAPDTRIKEHPVRIA